ncbi:MAG: ABC transporter permease [Tissierellia bacterium]|nr:ABC transporter permease [Tissierellia bacterium]
MKIVSCEFLKLKKSGVFLPLLVIPLISILFGGFNYYNNIEILTREWYSLWTQIYFFYGIFFFPVIIGVICSYL